MNRAISIPAALVLIGALVGGTLAGVIGVLVALPIMASILLIIREVVVPKQDLKVVPPGRARSRGPGRLSESRSALSVRGAHGRRVSVGSATLVVGVRPGAPHGLTAERRPRMILTTFGDPVLGKLLFRYLKTYRWLLLGVLVFQFASAMASLYLPRLNANIIDEGVSKGDTAYIWSTGTLMLGISLLQITTSIIATYFAARAAMAAGRDIRRDVYGKVSGFSEREVSNFGAGSLITRNTNDVQQVQMLAMMGATMLVTAPLLAIGGVIMALQQDVGLSWLIAVSVPLLLVIVAIIICRMVPLFRTFQTKLDAVNRIMREQLIGVRVVRAFVREDIEEDRFRGANTDIMVVGRKVGSLFVLHVPARDADPQRHRRRRDLVRRHPGGCRQRRDRHALRLHAVRRTDPDGRPDGDAS